MKRTQIYLEEETYKYLQQQSKATGKTISQLIRESIENKKKKKVQEILRKARKAYGIWKDRDFNVDKHLRGLREDRDYGSS